MTAIAGDRVGVRRSARRKPRRFSSFRVFTGVVAFGFAVLAVYPLLRVLIRLFYVDGELNFDALSEAFRQPGLWQMLGNTVFLVAASSVIAMIVGGGLAWLNERTDARMGFVSESLPLVPFLLPGIAAAIGWVVLLSPKAGLLNYAIRSLLTNVGIHLEDGPFNINSMYGLVFAYSVYMVPYVFLLVSAGLRNIDSSFEEQSRVCGAGVWTTLRWVTFPSVRPNLGAAGLLLVWFGFALFSIPVIIGTSAGVDVLSVRIVQLIKEEYPPRTDVAVGLSLFMAVAVGLSWYLQLRVLRRGLHATIGGKGRRATTVRLGKLRRPARILAVGYLLVSSVAPIVGLLLVSLNGFWNPKIRWSELSLDGFRDALSSGSSIREALRNSLTLGAIGALLGITAAALIALYVQRAGRLGRVADGAIRLPAVLSATVLALGVLLAFAGSPFRWHGTLIILFVGYLVVYMPQASVAADAAASQIGRELVEASHVSRAGVGRTFRRVQLPLMAAGLVNGWALLFVHIAGDTTVSALLAGSSTRVVGFEILAVFNNGSYAELATLSLLLCIVTAVVLVVVLTTTRLLMSKDRTLKTSGGGLNATGLPDASSLRGASA